MTETTSQPIKLFSDRSHYAQKHRAQLSDLLRPYWKDSQFSDAQRRQIYGLSLRNFELARALADADVAVLPMTWNYYLTRRELTKAADFIGAARRATRPILSYVSGDEGVTVPMEFDDVWVVRASGYRSQRRKRQVAQPVFFGDPLKGDARAGGEEHGEPGLAPKRASESRGCSLLAARSSPDTPPSVGFCGQASVSVLKLFLDVIRGAVRNGYYQAGLRKKEPQPIYPSVLLRARALRILRQSPLVRTEFIVRSRYRAGAVGVVAVEKTSREFYENMRRTDYTLCVRGGGNFSKRLYETLAVARIPLMVDTDCLMPFETLLPWEELIVRVPSNLLRTLPERVVEHFARTSDDGFAALQQKCRTVWEDFLSFPGFHCQLVRHVLDSRGAVNGFA